MSTGRSPRSARLSAIATPDGPAPITTTLTAFLRAWRRRGSAIVTKVTTSSGQRRDAGRGSSRTACEHFLRHGRHRVAVGVDQTDARAPVHDVVDGQRAFVR